MAAGVAMARAAKGELADRNTIAAVTNVAARVDQRPTRNAYASGANGLAWDPRRVDLAAAVERHAGLAAWYARTIKV